MSSLENDVVSNEAFNAPSPLTEQLLRHSLPSINSSIVTTLLTLLDSHRRGNPSSSPLGPTLTLLQESNPNRPLRILELGSGTGLVGMGAAATLGARVTVTDLPRVTENLRFNVELNGGVLGGRVDVAALRWGEGEAIGREFDLVVASDVVYYDDLYEPLLKTLLFLLLGEKRVVFVMAHLKRWKKEAVFFKKARKVFEVEVLHVDRPCEGSRVGVTVYRFIGKAKKKLVVNGIGENLK